MGMALIDTFGVSEYFTTHIQLENAGNGLIRSVRCVERNGMLIPVFSYVTPAICMIRNGLLHREFAEAVFKAELGGVGSH